MKEGSGSALAPVLIGVFALPAFLGFINGWVCCGSN